MMESIMWAGMYLIQVVLAVTLISSFAIVGKIVLRGSSAASRHWFVVIACHGLLLVPLLVAFLPSVSILNLPRWQSNDPESFPESTKEREKTLSLESSSDSQQFNDGFYAQSDPVRIRASLAQGGGTVSIQLGDNATIPFNEESEIFPGVRDKESTAHIDSVRLYAVGNYVVIALLAVYSFGLAIALLRLAFSHICVREILRDSHSVHDNRVQQIAKECYHNLHVAKHIRVVMSAQVQVPQVAGLVRSHIILPPEVITWSDDQIRASLTHEFAHQLRGDLRHQFFNQITVAMYWFHPLVHVLIKTAQTECELACDDQVIDQTTIGPEQYARFLVQIVESFNSGETSERAQAALGMSYPSSIELRINSLLVTRSNRLPPTRLRMLQSCSAVLLVCVAFSVSSPFTAAAWHQKVTIKGPAQDGSASVKDPTQADKNGTAGNHKDGMSDISARADLGQTLARASLFVFESPPFITNPIEHTSMVSINGRVTDASGETFVGGDVYLFASLFRYNRDMSSACPLIARSVIDPNGKFSFSNVSCPADTLRNLARKGCRWRIVACADDGRLAWKNLHSQTESAEFDIELSLKRAASIQGQVVKENGDPLVDAKISVNRFFDAAEFESMNSGRQFGRENGAVFHNVDFECRSNSQGGFRLDGLPSDSIVQVCVTHPDVVETTQVICANTYAAEVYESLASDYIFSWLGIADSKVVCPKGRLIRGKVIDEDGLAVPSFVNFYRPVISSLTDSDGLFEFRIPADPERHSQRMLSITSVDEHSHFWEQIDLRSRLDGDSEQLSRVLERKQHVNGLVVDTEGKPIEGVWILARLETDHDLSCKAVTGANGRFELEVAPGRVEVLLNGRIPGLDLPQANSRWANPDGSLLIWPRESLSPTHTLDIGIGDTEVPPLVVERTKPIDIVVVDLQGKPVNGATVDVLAAEGNTGQKEPAPLDRVLVPIAQQASTDERGRCSILPFAAPDVSTVVKVVSNADTPLLARYAFSQFSVTQLASITEHVIEATPALRVSGQITVEGQPIARVWVNVTPGEIRSTVRHNDDGSQHQRTGLRSRGQTLTVRTNDQGKYLAFVDPDHEYVVSINSGIPNDYRGGFNRYQAARTGTEAQVDIDLRRGPHEIMGRILGNSGQPIEPGSFHYFIKLRPHPRFDPREMYDSNDIETRADGRFWIKGLPRGEYQIELDFYLDDGRGTRFQRVITASASEATVVTLPITAVDK